MENIVEDLKSLPPDQLELAADYIQRLKRISQEERQAILTRTFGSLSQEDADEIEKAIEGEREPRTMTTTRRVSIRPALAVASIFLSLALGGLLVLASQQLNKRPISAIDPGEFHPVKISDIERTSMPHVMAEGYVSEVRANDEDGDLCFRLVDDLRQSGPFVVCEIIDSIKIQPPSVGSRVRVYGVSRFDSKEDHRWYEVHPVLDIEIVKD